MRPVLKPALRRVWRDDATLQLGADPRRALVLAGLDRGLAATLDRLDGSVRREDLAPEGVRMVDLLLAAGAVDDGSARPAFPGGPDTPARLAPDVASLSLVRPAPGAAAAALARRRSARVVVLGGGRVGGPLALLLAAAGVGAVEVQDDGPVRAADLSPGGLTGAEAGRTRAEALRPRLADGPAGPPALVVLAPPGAGVVQPAVAAGLVADHTPHLVAAVRETTGVVGPLVLPGATCCLGCLDLHRAERDPAWPRLAAQLWQTPRGAVDACDVALAAAVAAHAALQALAWVDAPPEAPPPASAGGTLELALPDWRLRRRSWAVHPACDCLS